MVDREHTVTKNALRRVWREKRDGLDEVWCKTTDKALFSCLHATDIWQKATCVLSYLSFGTEIDTRKLITTALLEGKTVALPRCVGPRQMQWHTIESLVGLERSKWGIEEPPNRKETLVDAEKLSHENQVLIVVPGLVFDRQGMRLGYGGGFYDTFLAQGWGTTVGLARSCQLVDDLACLGGVEEHDCPVEYVVCEQGIMHIGCS